MVFNPLRSWNTALRAPAAATKPGLWDPPNPILRAKEHVWDIQVRQEDAGEMAYLTAYIGDHYLAKAEGSIKRILFKQSSDGISWPAVNNSKWIYEGGASEAAFVFPPDADKLWAVLRLGDGDKRGWGSLVATASVNDLHRWHVDDKADPRRFDSPRLFVQDGEIYLLARQNICTDKDGNVDETKNCPFDRQFVGKGERKVNNLKDSFFDKLRNRFLSRSLTSSVIPGMSLHFEYIYYFKLPKRTALYWLNRKSRRFERLLSLPSAGDTAFPSIERLNDRELLIANYSSDPIYKDWTWKDGQQNRTGVYFVKLHFKKPE